MALKPVGSKGLLTLEGVDLVKFVPDMEAIQVATDNAIGESRTLASDGDATVTTNAANDATTKANQAKTDAIDDATTKYGGLSARITVTEAELDAVGIAPNYVVNGSFRDGFTGWANTGAWLVETSTATSWARTTSGTDAALTQSITIPAHLLGKTLRLYVLAMTTSTGTLQTKVTTVSGDTQLQHTLATGAYQLKTLDVAIPAGQGTTPITLAVGRWSGTVFMTAIRLEAL